jgi:hypothetical protein
MIPGAPENKKRDSNQKPQPEGDTSPAKELPADSYLRKWIAARNEVARLQEEIGHLRTEIAGLKEDVLILRDLVRE